MVATVVPPQGGGRGRRTQQGGVGGKLAEGVGLAVAARPQLDEVEVGLHQRRQPGQVVELQALAHPAGLHAKGANDDIQPFVAGKLPASLGKGLEIEPGELNRLQLLDVEGVIVVFHIVVGHGAFRPDAALENPLVLRLVETVVDGNARGVEVLHPRPGPFFLLEVFDVDLVDEGVLALLLHQHLGLVALVRPDIVLLDGLQHRGHAFLDLARVIAGAVPRQQELEHERGHVGPFLDVEKQVLADDLAQKYLVEFAVQIGGGHSRYPVLRVRLTCSRLVAGSRMRTVKLPEKSSSMRRPKEMALPDLMRTHPVAGFTVCPEPTLPTTVPLASTTSMATSSSFSWPGRSACGQARSSIGRRAGILSVLPWR